MPPSLVGRSYGLGRRRLSWESRPSSADAAPRGKSGDHARPEPPGHGLGPYRAVWGSHEHGHDSRAFTGEPAGARHDPPDHALPAAGGNRGSLASNPISAALAPGNAQPGTPTADAAANAAGTVLLAYVMIRLGFRAASRTGFGTLMLAGWDDGAFRPAVARRASWWPLESGSRRASHCWSVTAWCRPICPKGT